MGTVPGRPGSLRVSAKTRSWEQAESLARKYEITAEGGDEVKEARTLPTVKEAVKGYLADAEARALLQHRMTQCDVARAEAPMPEQDGFLIVFAPGP